MINIEEPISPPHFQEFERYNNIQQDQFHTEKQENESETEKNCNNTPTPTSPKTKTKTKTNINNNKNKSESKSNSFSKLVSSFSNVFSKKTETTSAPNSPTTTALKEKRKLEEEKNEQDSRMAYLIAELQAAGRSDEEIQMHLFHLRDVAQFRRPRSNSIGPIGEWFWNMHQAFKDEFAMRRESQTTTIHISSLNPFAAAASPNYLRDMGIGIGMTYEDLVALEPVPRGVKSLDKLPVVIFDGQELPSDQTSCAICMAEFETKEELKGLHCSHYFHKECVDKWLSVGTTCPVCKGEVDTD